ncbi:MAG: mechanosensitive ion channel family protein [Actinomycetota bacterium]|nr:mechanosensitive ion channel family protein [Actinomycetota bacterium]
MLQLPDLGQSQAETQPGEPVPVPCWQDSADNPLCKTVYEWTGGNEWLASASDWLIAKPLNILFLLVIGWLLRWVIHRLIDRLMGRAAQGSVPGIIHRSRSRQVVDQSAVAFERRQQRTATMGSLLKSITTAVIFGVIAVMVIDVLGYNIAPLLASAGILGLALGFGAQSLVADFLSGVFMILEDQYGVGDVVDVGDAVGDVEAVGLRVTRVRDIDGTVWYVRNGNIARVGNMSQNWARTVLDIRVAYDEDLDRVRAILGEVAHDLWEGEKDNKDRDILEEPEVWGVQSLDPEAVVIRLVLKTAPMQQWTVARELRERIKERFDAEGIEIPLPQRVIWHRGDEEPSSDGSRRSGAAAGV